MIPVYILTNNNHLWLLPPFAYLWNKYCPDEQSVTVAYTTRTIRLPHNFRWWQVGPQTTADLWSNNLLAMLRQVEKYFIIMLEDFWLFDYMDVDRISPLLELMDDSVLRIDLAGNRQSYKQAIEIAPGIVETPAGTPYQMSFQAAIWHRDNMLKVIEKNESPWQAEIEGSKRVDTSGLRVLGTKPAVIKYQPTWQHQKWRLEKMKTVDIEYMKARGWLDIIY